MEQASIKKTFGKEYKMRVTTSREKIIRLFDALGFKTADSWANEVLEEKAMKLSEIIDTKSFKKLGEMKKYARFLMKANNISLSPL